MLKMAGMSIEKSESLNFYKYLCQQIGSEKVVRTRRLAFNIRDLGHNMITSGSKGEGLNLNGSDLDVMIIDSFFKVYRSETEVQSQLYPIPLIMNTEETQPCFTQLWMLNQNIIITPNLMHRGYMLSSELYKRLFLSVADMHIPAPWSGKIHGPCISDADDLIDFASCLKCDKWIFQAKPWVSRPRTTWPPFDIISKIVSSGVLLVPIGHKGSINENVEWRISFSVAEKYLIFSFSHTQLLCYAMLKILLRDIIEKHEDLKGLLCSYFLKTVMFWISEETDPYVWRPDNMILCFMACLQRLLYCVRYSILSHYFIPDNNLFFLRFKGTNKDKLISLLTNLCEQGINCFASSETLHDYQSRSSKITDSVISKSVGCLRQIIPTFYAYYFYSGSDRNLRMLYYFLHHSRTALSRVLFALQISEASMHIPEQTQYPTCLENKNHYFRYKHDLSHLMIGLHFDAVSGLLKLASFFYVQKNFIASLTVIKYTLHKYTDEKIYMYANSCNHAVRCNHMQKHVANLMKNEKLNTTMKSLIFQPIGSVWNLSLVPQELLLDVTNRRASFHPVSFSHFLSFLCYYHLHDITSCIQSLQRLKHVQRTLGDCEFDVRCNDFVNTVIFCGIGHQLLGEEYSARHAFKVAARLDRNNVTSAASRLSRLI
ncbi:uncharacterized protein LOC127720676 [Mytilus californianus]|uniref:uncharacterized protein LOC127720676 n=1 Tax=Mytilus californianus TaxID=6549 RepID=UPI0022477812|nr:uncharacterized protein LOC127720676 [Mytilus californianus]